MHAHSRRRHFDKSASTKNTDKSVALHHLAGIADPQRDRHAGQREPVGTVARRRCLERRRDGTRAGEPSLRTKDELNFIDGETAGGAALAPDNGPGSLDEGYGATRSSALRRRRSVRIHRSNPDIAYLLRANGYDMEQSEILTVGAESDCTMSCASLVSNVVHHFLV